MFPLESINYDMNDFGTLFEEISYWLTHGFIPYMGGDYNSRLGDLNKVSQKTQKWRHTQNVDVVVNSHGRLLTGVCELNNCCYYGKLWDGNFTYHKAGKSSQIDFIFTNQHGRKYITDFKIIDTSWHLSDHLPLALHLRLISTPTKKSVKILWAFEMKATALSAISYLMATLIKRKPHSLQIGKLVMLTKNTVID